MSKPISSFYVILKIYYFFLHYDEIQNFRTLMISIAAFLGDDNDIKDVKFFH